MRMMERGRKGGPKIPHTYVTLSAFLWYMNVVWYGQGRQRTAQHVEPGKDSEELMRDQKDGAPISVRGFE
jgi:hypothetical protein